MKQNRILRKFKSLHTRASLFTWSVIRTPLLSKRSKVLLFGAPFHYNLGDHAQTLCAEEWIAASYPGSRLTTYDTGSASIFNFLALKMIKRTIKPSDVIFLHSGYHTTDLYPLENSLQKVVIEMFPDNQIVILPQTINYVNKKEQDAVSLLFNSHKNLTVMCRDDQSYEMAQEIFSSCKLLLFPDIVTSKIGTREYKNKKSGINLCLRNDKESLYKSTGIADQLIGRLKSIDKVAVTDTEGEQSPSYIRKNLSKVMYESWNGFSRYKVTVTDRYHGTIFSLIAGTPVVVLSSTDHKLKSGVKWFPENIFKGYVYYAESVDDAINYVNTIYKHNLASNLPTYFYDEYYSKLASKLTKEHI